MKNIIHTLSALSLQGLRVFVSRLEQSIGNGIDAGNLCMRSMQACCCACCC